LCFEINKFINSVRTKEELPQQWKESVIVPVYKKGDKTDCSNCRRISPTYYIQNFTHFFS